MWPTPGWGQTNYKQTAENFNSVPMFLLLLESGTTATDTSIFGGSNFNIKITRRGAFERKLFEGRAPPRLLDIIGGGVVLNGEGSGDNFCCCAPLSIADK